MKGIHDLALNARLLSTVAAIVLLLGMAVDLGVTRPKIRNYHRLNEEIATLGAKEVSVLQSERESQSLLRFLREQGLGDSLEAGKSGTPTTYLGELIETSGLTRLELRTTETMESKNLSRNKFVLRVSGKFKQTLDFLRSLEGGARLASIEELKIGPSSDRKKLETRLVLSIYDAL